MEVILALGGIGILALLLQSRYLPSEKDFERAAERLEKDYDDKRANQTVGMYLAFVEGEYEGAMQYLAKASSSILRKLAQHERDPAYTNTPKKKITMGDEWVKGVRNFRALAPIFYDRATFWYLQAWPKLDAAGKGKLRVRAQGLAAARPRGTPRKTLPKGWLHSLRANGGVPERDGMIARTGSHSIKVLPPSAVRNSYSWLITDLFPVTGKEAELSAYVRSDGTENGTDRFMVWFYDATGRPLGSWGPFIPVDLPFWTPISMKVKIPENATRAQVGVVMYSNKGHIWIDDVSMKVDGGENIVPNPSLEK